MANGVSACGEGHTCDRIVHAIEYYFGLRADAPTPFQP